MLMIHTIRSFSHLTFGGGAFGEKRNFPTRSLLPNPLEEYFQLAGKRCQVLRPSGGCGGSEFQYQCIECTK